MTKLNKFFYLESIQDNYYDYIKKNNASIILRNKRGEDGEKYSKIINNCKKLGIQIFISNDINLVRKFNLKNLYISAYNKSFYHHENLNIIGSAHNHFEIYEKKKQKCRIIFVSRLFNTEGKKGSLGIVRFNLLTKNYNGIIALGGINQKNIKKIKLLKCQGYAIKSELKNRPNYLI